MSITKDELEEICWQLIHEEQVPLSEFAAALLPLFKKYGSWDQQFDRGGWELLKSLKHTAKEPDSKEENKEQDPKKENTG